MRLLLDECVDRRLAEHILGHDVKTVPEAGWSGDFAPTAATLSLITCSNEPDRTPLDHHGLHGSQAGGGSNRMAAKLMFRYDREADILHIDKCPPYGAQESEELGDEVVARINPTTEEIENLEVLFFSTRLLRSDLFELPISAELRVVRKKSA